MSDQATQTVVDEAKTPAQPGAADNSARKEDDLDTLLAAFDDQGKPSSPEPAKPEPKGAAPDQKSAPAVADDGIADVRQYIFRQDMNATIKSVRGDLDPEQFDDALVEAWMDARARQDPRLARAWIDRHKNPTGFKRVIEGLGRDFNKKYGKMMPDKGATEDREAVVAAVRGASTKAPEGKAPDFGRMTEGEFQAWKDQHM